MAGLAAAPGMLVRRTPPQQAPRRAFARLQRSSAEVTTISGVSEETSPGEGMAGSGHFPAAGARSASLPCRAFCVQPGFRSGCISLSSGSPSTSLAIFILCQFFTSFETFCPLATWIAIG